MPDWSDPSKVLSTVQAGDEVSQARGENRVLINKAANNEPLVDEEEAKRLKMKIYNRWGELMLHLADARRQYINNFVSPVTYFSVSIPKAAEEVRSTWEGFITEALNEKLKEGDNALEYFELHRSRWAAVVCHGIGPMMWEDKYTWLPRYVAIEDLRIATDVELSFRNLVWFAIRIAYTPGELSRRAFSKAKSKFTWNKKAVASILKNVEEINTVMADNNYDWTTTPEKFEELRKQNCGYWDGDAMPTINLWHFYHQDEDGKWYLKVVPENTTSYTSPETTDEFICQSDEAVADNWRQILHVQFGDLNNKAPFLYHSVRSLGFALFDPCYWTDYLRCKLLQHTLDQFNWLLKITDPIDRARAAVQMFQDMAVMKPGVSIVPANERHQVDAALVESVMAQTTQLQDKASTAYSGNIDDGTAREQTAFETGVKVQKNNALLSGLMLVAQVYEKFACKEICRRFCLPNSDDEDVKDFQASCKKAGIPKAWLDVKKWRVEITLPLGSGNPTMAMVEAQNALAIRPMLDPGAQTEALRDAATQMVGSVRANRWIKPQSKAVSQDAAVTAGGFNSMMLGVMPQIPEGTNPLIQAKTLIALTAQFILKITHTTKIPTLDQMAGLQNVLTYIAKLLQGMAGDKGNEPKVKEFAKGLNQLENEVKKLAQHMQQAMQKQQQQNGENGNGAETAAKIQATMAETQAKIKSQSAITQQKLMSKEKGDIQKRRHADTKFKAEQQRQNVKTVADIARDRARQPMEKSGE